MGIFVKLEKSQHTWASFSLGPVCRWARTMSTVLRLDPLGEAIFEISADFRGTDVVILMILQSWQSDNHSRV